MAPTRPRIAVVGAGFGGIGVAAALLRAGYPAVTVLEKADAIGGVWRDNAYPGCGCDVPAQLYSFSFAPNPDWTRWYPPQAEILAYLRTVARDLGVQPKVRLRTEVTAARWDDAAGVWRLALRPAGEPDADAEELVADVLVPATGQLSRPSLPRLPGLASFAGAAFHTARWDHAADLRGKRVGVIGTGATAIQVVPAIAGVAGHTTVFQRTPPWTLPKADFPVSARERALRRRVPAVLTAQRLAVWGVTVFTGLGITGDGLPAAVLRTLSRAQLRLQVPDRELRARLTPDYPMGCKRVLFSNDWLPALRRDDVTLVDAAVAEVLPHGVRTADGTEHALDALVWATGFDADSFLAPIRVTGRDGAELDGAWRDGAQAYLGMTVPGFPNLFVLYGPNTNTGNTSVLYFEESQARYIVQAVRRIERQRAALEVRDEVARHYDGEIQHRLASSVWVSCSSWYRSATGRVVTNWPGRAAEYRRRTRRLRPSDFVPVRPAGAGTGRPPSPTPRDPRSTPWCDGPR